MVLSVRGMAAAAAEDLARALVRSTRVKRLDEFTCDLDHLPTVGIPADLP